MYIGYIYKAWRVNGDDGDRVILVSIKTASKCECWQQLYTRREVNEAMRQKLRSTPATLAPSGTLTRLAMDVWTQR